MDRRMTTLRALEEEGARLLEAAGIGEARLDAHRLLLAAFQLDETHYLLNRSEPAEEPGDGRYREMIGRRAARIPLQQILGQQEFMGLTFQVDRHVLIPRQDTETLVELVLAEQTDPRKRVLDLCTGSGCIAVAVKHLRPDAQVWASDLSEDVLTVARLNADYHQADICFVQSDLLEDIPERFDLIVSNPPYIETAEIEDLAVQVRDYEPRMALDGGADGLAYYRRILRTAGSRLHPKGRLLLEIGCGQGQTVSALAAENGWTDIEIQKDLAGCDRVLSAKMRSEICNV